jgi:predicted kinase
MTTKEEESMSLLPCPEPPDWKIDWATIDAFPWIREMKGCPQNPSRHAEGDVWTHVHMVCEAMVSLPVWQSLPENERRLLFTAALLHDVAKPACTRVEPDGSISSRGHSWKGAVRGRQILWRRGVPFSIRESISALVRHHLVPFFLADSENPKRLAIEVSQTVRCDWLSILAESDARGRKCPDPDHLLQQIELFREKCAEVGCLSEPYRFPSDHARFLFFRDVNRQPDSPAYEEFKCDVTLMSGLPGSGKDHWLKQNMNSQKIISLDELRIELGVAPSDPQGEVLNRAREMAREYLRQGESFVWNATNLSRHIRGECVRLFHDYGARVRIIYLEVPPDRLFSQNRSRKRKVPESVIERLLDRWEVPDRTEAHQVDWIVS